MNIKALLPILLAAATTSASAQYFNGNQLLAHLNGTPSERMMAIGYVGGVHDSLDGIVFCSPGSATLGQVRDVVMQQLQAVPETRHRPANLLMASILGGTWPCKNSPKSQSGQL